MSRKTRKKKGAQEETPETPETRPVEAEPAPEKVYSPEEIQALERKAGERDEFLDQLQRKTADYINREKRIAREFEEVRKYGAQSFVSRLFGALDNFERALESARMSRDLDSLLEGVELTHREFMQALEAGGVKRIEAKGEPFDPYYHEAVAQVESDEVEPGCVAEVFQPGYLLHDRVIRHARVTVARPPEPPEPEEESPAEDDEAGDEAGDAD